MKLLQSLGRGHVALALGLLLILNPLYIDILHLDQPVQYVYSAGMLEFDEDGYPYVESAENVRPLDGDAACLEALASRICELERYVLANGGVPSHNPDAIVWARVYPYAFVDGQFYDAETVDREDGSYLTLEPVPRDEALEQIASSGQQVSPAVRRVIDSGEPVVRYEPLEQAHEIVAYDDGHYVVYESGWRGASLRIVEEQKRQGRRLETALMTIGLLAGVAVILSAQRYVHTGIWI